MKRYEVDPNGCIGCGLCASVCPQIFRMKDDGLAEAYKNGDDPAAEEAAESCPVRAISGEEE